MVGEFVCFGLLALDVFYCALWLLCLGGWTFNFRLTFFEGLGVLIGCFVFDWFVFGDELLW